MKLDIERVPVKCGNLTGWLILRKSLVEVEDAKGNVKRVAPTEFEAMAGRGSTKKWKDSVKIGPDLPEFEGRAIGAYMREELGVDINRGSLVAYNPDKKNANEKASKASTAAAASNKQSLPSSQPLSKAAGKPAASRNAKSGPSKSPAPPRNKSNNKRRSPEPTPSDSPSSESEPSSAPDDVVFAEDQTTKLFLKMPLLERFNLHSDKQPCCYEPPCEVYRYQRDLSREDLAEASTASILMKASGSSADASPKRLEVPISHGKPKHAKGILCLESVPMHSLMDLGLMSAKQEADLSNILLSEVPEVPASRLSHIPQYEQSSKKRARVR